MEDVRDSAPPGRSRPEERPGVAVASVAYLKGGRR